MYSSQRAKGELSRSTSSHFHSDLVNRRGKGEAIPDISHWLGDVNLFCSWKHMVCCCACLSCDIGEKSNEDFFPISFRFICFSALCLPPISTDETWSAYMKPDQPTWNLTRANASFCTWDRWNSRHKYKLREECLENSPAERNLGMLVDGKFNLS